MKPTDRWNEVMEGFGQQKIFKIMIPISKIWNWFKKKEVKKNDKDSDNNYINTLGI